MHEASDRGRVNQAPWRPDVVLTLAETLVYWDGIGHCEHAVAPEEALAEARAHPANIILQLICPELHHLDVGRAG